ncbi:transposase [Xinfangfangia sp. CPCC 101601]|uniref:Transposase n=1 Tax=Pseudogemmobacter lacusdianii TaxID=3069608 RepID=A0ABU0VZG6_9RHOB|nr:transposase [Xinfangfangia sp. CPCC 101601]MDQ2067144.1 transposase [Xinfangfangia sp. CPCC 101601]
MRHVEVLGRERRRHWSDAEKISVLGRVGVDGRTVADVAREADLTRQHIYQWRQELRRKGLWPVSGSALFVQVDEDTAGLNQPLPPGSVPMIEILLRNGRQIRCTEVIDDRSLARLIRVLETV